MATVCDFLMAAFLGLITLYIFFAGLSSGFLPYPAFWTMIVTGVGCLWSLRRCFTQS